MDDKKNLSMSELFGEVIHAYTRANAFADGFLVDVTTTAKEAGFKWPVALTRAVWLDCVEWTAEDTKRQTYQDEPGRLWDVVYMASLAARSGDQSGLYEIFRVPRGGKGITAKLVSLKMVAGPGDDGEPVITIMQPSED